MAIQLRPELKIANPPTALPFQLPPEDEEKFAFVRDALVMTYVYASDLVSAITMFDFCRLQEQTLGRDMAMRWQMVAARDGAMSLHHYSYSFELARNRVKAIPALGAVVDLDKLKRLRKEFVTKFPTTLKMRHAVAHSSDLFENEAKRKANKPKSSPTVVNSLMNDKFVTTIDGELVEYAVNADTALFIADLTRRFFAEFPDVFRELPGLRPQPDQTSHQS